MIKIISAIMPSGPNMNLRIKLVIAPIILKISPNNETKMITARIINNIVVAFTLISSYHIKF